MEASRPEALYAAARFPARIEQIGALQSGTAERTRASRAALVEDDQVAAAKGRPDGGEGVAREGEAGRLAGPAGEREHHAASGWPEGPRALNV